MKNLTLKDFLSSIGHKVCGGGEFLWDCYGKNVYCLDAEKKGRSRYLFSTSVMFDTKNYKVYQMDSWDYKKRCIYRWIHPQYYKKFMLENKSRGMDLEPEAEKHEILYVSAAKIIKETSKLMKSR